MVSTRLILRTPEDRDWPAIAKLADISLAHVSGAPPQDGWAGVRRAFVGEQMHWVACREDRVAGYAAIERKPDEPEGLFRVFVVTSWAESRDAAETLYEELAAELSRRDAHTAWLRELAGDTKLIDFARARGFEIRESYELGGFDLVNLFKDLRANASA